MVESLQGEFPLEMVTKNGHHKISPAAMAVFTVPEYDEDIYTVYRLLCTGQVKRTTHPTFPSGMREYLGQIRAMTEKEDVNGTRFGGPHHNCWILFVRRDEISRNVIFTMDSGESTCGDH